MSLILHSNHTPTAPETVEQKTNRAKGDIALAYTQSVDDPQALKWLDNPHQGAAAFCKAARVMVAFGMSCITGTPFDRTESDDTIVRKFRRSMTPQVIRGLQASLWLKAQGARYALHAPTVNVSSDGKHSLALPSRTIKDSFPAKIGKGVAFPGDTPEQAIQRVQMQEEARKAQIDANRAHDHLSDMKVSIRAVETFNVEADVLKGAIKAKKVKPETLANLAARLGKLSAADRAELLAALSAPAVA